MFSPQSKFPKVSIVTVVFNAAKTLEQTILSVLNQNYPNIEYIIVDGGSTDGSLEIINKYKNRITNFITEPDKGIGDAFNKGIYLCTGDVVGLINADDWYTDDAVTTAVNAMNAGYDLFCANIELISENSDQKLVRKSKLRWLNYGMYINHPTMFIRKIVYDEVGRYDVNLKIAMDFDMILRVKKSKKFKFVYVDKVVTIMRTGGASSNFNAMVQEENYLRKKHLKGFNYLRAIAFQKMNHLRLSLLGKKP